MLKAKVDCMLPYDVCVQILRYVDAATPLELETHAQPLSRGPNRLTMLASAARDNLLWAPFSPNDALERRAEVPLRSAFRTRLQGKGPARTKAIVTLHKEVSYPRFPYNEVRAGNAYRLPPLVKRLQEKFVTLTTREEAAADFDLMWACCRRYGQLLCHVPAPLCHEYAINLAAVMADAAALRHVSALFRRDVPLALAGVAQDPAAAMEAADGSMRGHPQVAEAVLRKAPSLLFLVKAPALELRDLNLLAVSGYGAALNDVCKAYATDFGINLAAVRNASTAYRWVHESLIDHPDICAAVNDPSSNWFATLDYSRAAALFTFWSTRNTN